MTFSINRKLLGNSSPRSERRRFLGGVALLGGAALSLPARARSNWQPQRTTRVASELQHKDMLLRVNESAELILEHCDGRHSIDQLAGLLADRYQVAFVDARHDTCQYLGLLKRLGMVK